MGLQLDPANPMGLPVDSMPHGYKRENLDFNNILKQFGVASLNKFMGMPSSSEDEASKKSARFFSTPKEEVKKEEPPKPSQPPKQGNVQQRVGLIESIMNENRQASKRQKEAQGAS